ncbi:MAG: phosphoribosylamine--glycine ligase [Acidobacteria bacterium]|nr:phosphoribosylamine--glycine ligase [Acidobacteriota bacterium]
MKILVIGSGGREHALCWKFEQSKHTTDLYCAPGNAGIAEVATCVKGNLNDVEGLAELAEKIGADLTFVGPEAPLVAGIAEAFAAKNLRIVAPSKTAAQLEGSKIFAKEFLARHRIPTAQFAACDSRDAARQARHSGFQFPVVVKADGLAAGKGVRIVQDQQEFDEALHALMGERVFGEAGARIVLEECLFGREASLMIFTDGSAYQIIAPAQDYKRAYDHDEGLNTGGMGSFSIDGLIDEALLERCKREIIEPTLQGLNEEGYPFCGVLYIGLMFTEAGPKVIEYNARFGDPETQAILVRLESDLVEICEAIVEKRLAAFDVKWSAEASVCVVAASGGYPGEFEKGKEIHGIEEASQVEGVTIFHAGTTFNEDAQVITNGGRVLGVTARARTRQEARSRAYEALGKIQFERMHYRRDIAD